MPKKKNITVDELWRIERLGPPSLAPDGAQAVAKNQIVAIDVKTY